MPTSIGGIEAWIAYDAGAPITLVRSRPDIVEDHRAGRQYFSNIAALEADLRAIEAAPRRDDELALREVRRIEGIPIGIFDPFDGWVLRDLLAYLRVEAELAASLALTIYRSYSGGPNAITRDGNLVRCTLPWFENIWDRESPSLIGNEPDINKESRVEEALQIYVDVGGDPDASELAALERDEHPDPGPALLRAIEHV